MFETTARRAPTARAQSLRLSRAHRRTRAQSASERQSVSIISHGPNAPLSPEKTPQYVASCSRGLLSQSLRRANSPKSTSPRESRPDAQRPRASPQAALPVDERASAQQSKETARMSLKPAARHYSSLTVRCSIAFPPSPGRCGCRRSCRVWTLSASRSPRPTIWSTSAMTKLPPSPSSD